jgi:LysM repeat protein
LSIANEQNGDENQLFFDVNCEIECEVMKNTENVLTKDCYSTKYETEPTYKYADLYSVLKNANGSFTLSENVKRKSKDINETIDILATPVYEKTEIKGQKAFLIGKTALTVIGKSAADENGDSEYLSEEYEIPFKYECDVTKISTETLTRADFAVGNINARYDSDKFYFTAEMFPSVSILGKESVKILDTAILKKDKEYKNNASCVRVYFPKENDTVWEVAKKYHTTSKKIAEENSVSSQSLKDVKNIII